MEYAELPGEKIDGDLWFDIESTFWLSAWICARNWVTVADPGSGVVGSTLGWLLVGVASEFSVFESGTELDSSEVVSVLLELSDGEGVGGPEGVWNRDLWAGGRSPSGCWESAIVWGNNKEKMWDHVDAPQVVLFGT